MDLPLPHPASAAEPATLSWRQRWQAWRDRTLSSPEFQRRAARSWWMRPIARQRARGLFDLVAGFVYSQVLLACVRLSLFDLLAQGPLSAAELAQRLDVPADGIDRLLAAACALDLLEHRTGGGQTLRYGLGKLGAPMVGNEAISALVEHHAVLYADLQDPVALLRGSGAPPALSRYWAYATAAAPGQLKPEQVNDYSALMSASQPLVAQEVLDSYDFGRHQALLDVGGGQGRFLRAVARRHGGLRLMLFDLPGVVPVAQAAFEADGIGSRAAVHGGDFTRDPLPSGADVASLVRVIYDHPDERALAILRAVHRALPPGGTLVLAEPMAGAPGAPRMGDAYFGFYLLAMQGGRSRTAAELQVLLEAAGFEQVHERPTPIPLQVGVLVARRPLQVGKAGR
jgi:demethylspheroidene O-methyltransferase